MNGIPECDLQLLQTYNFCKSGKINLPSAQWQERISYLQKKWVELGKFIGSYTILSQKWVMVQLWHILPKVWPRLFPKLDKAACWTPLENSLVHQLKGMRRLHCEWSRFGTMITVPKHICFESNYMWFKNWTCPKSHTSQTIIKHWNWTLSVKMNHMRNLNKLFSCSLMAIQPVIICYLNVKWPQKKIIEIRGNAMIRSFPCVQHCFTCCRNGNCFTTLLYTERGNWNLRLNSSAQKYLELS